MDIEKTRRQSGPTYSALSQVHVSKNPIFSFLLNFKKSLFMRSTLVVCEVLSLWFYAFKTAGWQHARWTSSAGEGKQTPFQHSAFCPPTHLMSACT